MGMWIAIGCAVLVLGAAAYAGLGHLGQMQLSPVLDRPRGRVPAGPVTPGFLTQLTIPVVASGYDTRQVDAYLAEVAAGTALPPSEAVFVVGRKGYDMEIVDELLRRPLLEVGSVPQHPVAE